MLVLSLVPTTPEMPATGWDKGNHFLGFAVLAFLCLRAYPQRAAAMLAGLLLYGGLIEVLQSFTAYRSAEWGDLLADAIGIAGGLLMHRAMASHNRNRSLR